MRYLITLIILLLIDVSAICQYAIQYYSYSEENSSIHSTTCYNWVQLPNGEIYLTNNSGIEKFDGSNFYFSPTKGKGKGISSAIIDPMNKLWCNSFLGDLFYLENGSFKRHSISDSITGVTTLKRLNNRFFLITEKAVYEYQSASLSFKKLIQEDLIFGLIEYKNNIWAINNVNKEKVEFVDTSGKRISIALSEKDFSSPIFTLENGLRQYLFFSSSQKLIALDDFLSEKLERAVSLNYHEKINHAIIIDNSLFVSGMNGVGIYNMRGEKIDSLLTNVQVNYFNKDEEGNYLAATVGDGLILIPSLHTHVFNYQKYIAKSSFIISSIAIGDSVVVHGTNAGEIIYHHLSRNKIKTLKIGYSSEVISLAHSEDNTLYAYCDSLFEIDYERLKILKSTLVTSTKNMISHNSNLLMGTRNSVFTFSKNKVEKIKDLGWNLSMVYDDEYQHFLISTEKGIYKYKPFNKQIKRVELKGVQTDRIVDDLQIMDDYIYFSQDYQNIFKLSRDFKQKEKIYTHATRSINNISLLDSLIAITTLDTVSFINIKGEPVKSLTKINGLNDKRTNHVFQLNNQMVFVHPTSLTLMRGFPSKNESKPTLSYSLSTGGSFEMKDGVLTSYGSDNSLNLKLDIKKGIRSRGAVQVFYSINKKQNKWIEILNPYADFSLERLPFGKGKISLKAKNEEGEFSPILSINYMVHPPFYLRWWFIAIGLVVLLVFILFIFRWRITTIRKKSLENLKKKQLESRALNAELTAIRSQMNPHFIFNVLTAIQAKVIEGKLDEAYQNIGNFADLIRNVLEKSGKEYLLLQEEIALVKKYIELENSRLQTAIQFTVSIDNLEFFEDVLVPTLITQPIVENAVKHAFPSHFNKEKKVHLEIEQQANGFTLTLEDNGVGISKSELEEEGNHDSFALDSIRKRIANLSQQSDYEISMKISSSKLGTKVFFHFNYKS